MPSNNQNRPDDRSIRSSATIPSRRETYRNQKTRKAQKQRHAKASSKRRGCFFWTLLVIVVTLIFGGHYAYKKYISAKKQLIRSIILQISPKHVMSIRP